MRRLIGIVLAALAFGIGHAQSQEEEEAPPASSSLSRTMRMAVMFYEKGDDIQAMDQFMDILTQGDPAERPMANDYINLITQRMNMGGADSSSSKPAEPSKVGEARPVSVAPMSGDSAATEDPLPAANKDLMKKEIKTKIRAVLEKSIAEIKSVQDVRLVMQENGDPRAIGIPSPLLFSSGIAFRKTAGKLLDALTRLTYSLGSTKVIMLPEGAAIGDAKVLDMRRTMGVSAHFFSAGIAPPRVKVNLLNNQVEIPKALQDFKGIVIVFVYNEPLSLAVESSLGEEAGPPLSLGVFPPSFRPERNEGVIIELSVSDPPAGLTSWKFQLLQPSSSAGGDLAPLQQIVGDGAVFHQIYWNGRRNYFGPLLPGGRYECVLTATDRKNRQRTLHKWIELLEDGTVAAPAAAASGKAAVPTGTAPAADLDGPVKAQALIKAFKPESQKKSGAQGKKRKIAVEAETEASTPPKPSKPASGNYELAFNKGTHQLAPEGEKMLSKVAESVSFYPLESLKLIGYANPSEPDTAALAERRAQMVAGLLINKYQVEPKKIQVSSKVGEDQPPQVEVYFVGNE